MKIFNSIKLNNFYYSLIIYSSAFFLKYLYFLYSDGFNRLPVEDAAAYFNIGKEIFLNGYFSDQFISGRPPLLPSIISLFFIFFDETTILVSIRLFLIMITSLIPVIFYFICINIKINKPTAFFIALFILIYPPSIYYSSFILTENLASFLISLIILLISFFSKVQKKKLLIVNLSLLFALLTFTRSIFVALPFFIFIIYIFLIIKNKKNLIYLRKFILMIICYIIFMSPWAIINKFKHDELIITTNRLGYMLYLTNSDLKNSIISRGQYLKTNKFLEDLVFARENFNYKDESKYLKNLAIEEIFKNISIYPKILFNRFINTMNSRPNPYKSNLTINDIIMLVWIPILILSIKYIINNRLEPVEKFFLIIIVYTIGTSLPFWGTPRFRYPIDNLIIFFALRELSIINLTKVK